MSPRVKTEIIVTAKAFAFAVILPVAAHAQIVTGAGSVAPDTMLQNGITMALNLGRYLFGGALMYHVVSQWREGHRKAALLELGGDGLLFFGSGQLVNGYVGF